MASQTPFMATLVGSLVCLGAGVLVFLLAITGILFQKPSPATDIGLYSIVVVLVGFGVGGILLRKAKLSEESARGF